MKTKNISEWYWRTMYRISPLWFFVVVVVVGFAVLYGLEELSFHITF